MSGGDWKEMFTAIQNGDLALVEYYLKAGIDPNYQHPEYLAAPLVESIRFGHLAIAQLIMEHGGDPAIKEVWGGETPLSVARIKRDKAAIKLLDQYLQA